MSIRIDRAMNLLFTAIFGNASIIILRLGLLAYRNMKDCKNGLRCSVLLLQYFYYFAPRNYRLMTRTPTLLATTTSQHVTQGEVVQLLVLRVASKIQGVYQHYCVSKLTSTVFFSTTFLRQVCDVNEWRMRLRWSYFACNRSLRARRSA